MADMNIEEKVRENEENAVLQVKNLHTSFFTDSGEVKAVNGVSFNLGKGKILGVVGESGSGKSVTAYSIMQILADTGKVVEGEILFKGQNILDYSKKEMDAFRGKKVSIIFQDPMTSLNPTFTIGWQLREALQLHTEYKTKKQANKRAIELLEMVGVNEPESRIKQYPFELSGGMRQRVMIAMALACEPDILIADEPTTALDVTIQAQILELINRLKRERQLSCIFITHDLGVVANMADRVALMYAGKIVEYGTSYEVFFDPKHPYTWALLSSIPDIDSKEKLESIPGTPPDMRFPIEGDAFALRSKYAMAIDFKSEPPYFKVSPTHYAATWLLHPKAKKVEMPKIVKTRIENALKGAKNNEKE